MYVYISKDGGLFLDDKKTNLTGGARNTIAAVDRREAIVVAPVTSLRPPSIMFARPLPYPPIYTTHPAHRAVVTFSVRPPTRRRLAFTSAASR